MISLYLGKLESLRRKLHPLIGGIKYLAYNPASNKISLHCPEFVNPDKKDHELVKRIFSAFGKMKEDQKKANKIYLASSLWQKQLDDAYLYLNIGLQENNIDKFHYFLENFGTWKEYHGVEHNVFIRSCMKSVLKRRYLQNDVFYRQLKIWQWFYNNRKPISLLSYPNYGNQSGAYINGVFVGVGSFFNEIYGSLLSGIIRDSARPIIADLGAGYGRLAYFILRNFEKFTFIDFDLPETLCLATYYLMKTFPQKRALLYGEEELSPAVYDKYDFIFMPAFEISKVGSKIVDLFINKNSLGEMTKEAANNFVKYITRSTRYFFHMNHDRILNSYDNKETGLLAFEYPVSENEFRLLFRYPDLGHMFYQGGIDFKEDIFIYLYERKNNI